jgi:hypothetical protein
MIEHTFFDRFRSACLCWKFFALLLWGHLVVGGGERLRMGSKNVSLAKKQYQRFKGPLGTISDKALFALAIITANIRYKELWQCAVDISRRYYFDTFQETVGGHLDTL